MLKNVSKSKVFIKSSTKIWFPLQINHDYIKTYDS